MKISNRQLEAAISLAGLTGEKLCELSNTGIDTLSKFVTGKSSSPRETTFTAWRSVLEANGVEFLENEGVRRRPQDIEVFEGKERFQDFLHYLRDHLALNGGEVCISVNDERRLQACYVDIEAYRAEMKKWSELKLISGRILATEGNFKKTWSALRRRKKSDHMPQTSFFVFGDNLALVALEHDPSPYVVLHKSSPFAAGYKIDFNSAWEDGEEV